MDNKKEYISREAALKVVCMHCCDYSGEDSDSCCDCMEKHEMSKIPIADVVERDKIAEWILSEDGYYVCSECGKVCPYDVNEGGVWYWTCHYCPCCGLKMNESVILNG